MGFVAYNSVCSLVGRLFRSGGSTVCKQVAGHLSLRPFDVTARGRVLERCRPTCAPTSLLYLCVLANKITGCVRALVSRNTFGGRRVLAYFAGRCVPFLARKGSLVGVRFEGRKTICCSVLDLVTSKGGASNRVSSILNVAADTCLHGLRVGCALLGGVHPVFTSRQDGKIGCGLGSGFLRF